LHYERTVAKRWELVVDIVHGGKKASETGRNL